MGMINDAAEKDLSYYKLPLIQQVIHYKWQAYTRTFFIFQFMKALAFIICFVADIILTNPEEGPDPTSDSKNYLTGVIITRSICSLYILDYFIYEFK